MSARAPLFSENSFLRTHRVRVAGLAIATIALAACGSSAAKTSSSPTVPSTAPAGTSAPTAKAVVATTQNAKLGAIVVDAEGRTLYTLTNGGKPVACTGTCAQVWPPALLPSGVTSPGTNVAGLTTVAMNGGQQIAINGDPLYRFSADTKPGDTNGQGITSFGGTWHAATTSAGSGSAATPSATQAAPPTTSSSSGGGGYSYP